MKKIKSDIERWLKNTIVEFGLCPFAKAPYERGAIKLTYCDSESDNEKLDFFVNELQTLESNENKNVKTSILVFSNGELEFHTFLNFFEVCEDLLDSMKLTGEVQAVVFHPRFQFDGLKNNDLANYVNRSPYPLIHLLKASDIEKVMNDPKEGEKISLENEKKLKGLSKEELKFHYFW